MAETKRRLSAIMFSDIQGFSSMMGEDEEATLSLLDEHNSIILPIIEKNRGEVLKFIGDALLSSFESAVDAVRAGSEIQAVLAKRNLDLPGRQKILVRIGIHIGDVVIREKDIFGDGVNVASRIEPLAEPGGICITQSVYDMLKGRPEIKAVSLGMKELKNIKDAVHIYKVLLEAEEIEAAEASPPRPEEPVIKEKRAPSPRQRRGVSWKFVIFVMILGIGVGLYLSGSFDDFLADSGIYDPYADTYGLDTGEQDTEQWTEEDRFPTEEEVDVYIEPQKLDQRKEERILTEEDWRPPGEEFDPSSTGVAALPRAQVDTRNWLSTNQVQQQFSSGGVLYDLNGDGISDARYWSYDSNYDGVPDYGGYDMNLNGRIDQWLYYRSEQPNGVVYGFDSDENGVIEVWGWNTDNDQLVDMWGWDNSGDGRTDTWGWDKNRNNVYDLYGYDIDWDNVIDYYGDDANEDGIIDYWAWDQNGNNIFDKYGWDTNGDGTADRWGDDWNEDGVVDRYY
jgi:class 3 adenylate cyclase